MGRIDLNDLTDASRALNEPESKRRKLWESFHERAAELDGRVFECVSSTRIYCRPTCKGNKPKFENCLFVASAAEAEALGYRPCMRCRSELSPGTKAVGGEAGLAWRALALAREYCSDTVGLPWAAGRLGASEDEVEAALRQSYGAGFTQVLLICRLRLAKALLTDTRIDVEQIAGACGFGDAASLEAHLKERYRMVPGDLRKRTAPDSPEGAFSLRLDCRAPSGFGRLLEFFRARELEGVERVDDRSYSRTARVRGLDGHEHIGWVRVWDDGDRGCLRLTVAESLLPIVSQVVARVRRTFDLDCEPVAVYEGLRPLESVVSGANVLGTRVPGAFDPFEIAVRAVLGQQVSVKAANKLAARIAESFGKPVSNTPEGLRFLFPRAEDFLAMDPIEDALGQLGVIKTRSRTIRSLAELVADGQLDLSPTADVPEQMRKLLEVKGIGAWSQNYLSMRTLGYTDAFLEADSGIKHALPGLSPKERLAAVEACRPWRAYANLCLWNSLSD